MSETTKKEEADVVGCLTVCGCLVPMMIWEGFVATICWRWFVVPFGLPPIGVAQAMGLVLTVAVIHPRVKNLDDAKKVKPMRVIGRAFGDPLILLGLAYLVHLFMGAGK